jgi:lysine 2,3-aminomutase
VSASNDAVVLRNYEGMLVRYQAEDKPQTVQPTVTRGVSSLLQGSKSALIPENSERMARRRLHVLAEEAAAAAEQTHEHNGCDHGANGHGRPEDLLPLGILTNGRS